MRLVSAVLATALSTLTAEAHFYFILPAETGESAKLVLSNEAKIDAQADPGPAELFTVMPSGRIAPGGAGFLKIEGVSSGAQTLTVAPPQRVSQTNYPEPTLVIHDARWQLAPSAVAAPSEGLALSCYPGGGGTLFAVTLNGKPIAARLTISAPGLKRPVVIQTGPDGLSSTFMQKGLLSAHATLGEAKPGEHKGQKYKQIRRYSTLTTMVE